MVLIAPQCNPDIVAYSRHLYEELLEANVCALCEHVYSHTGEKYYEEVDTLAKKGAAGEEQNWDGYAADEKIAAMYLESARVIETDTLYNFAEAERCLAKLARGKAPGGDGLTTEVLRCLPTYVRRMLHICFLARTLGWDEVPLWRCTPLTMFPKKKP